MTVSIIKYAFDRDGCPRTEACIILYIVVPSAHSVVPLKAPLTILFR